MIKFDLGRGRSQFANFGTAVKVVIFGEILNVVINC